MNYKGYNIQDINNTVVIEGVDNFNATHTFECGQCFRWYKQSDGSYTGVAKGKVINVRYETGNLIIENTNTDDFIDIWYNYFDLGTNYSEMIFELSQKDDVMYKATQYGYGIRLLRQDPWETLISFIISANNSIPRIMKNVKYLSELYGKEIVYNGDVYYTFPDIYCISSSNIEMLEKCGAGFRCKYIHKSAMMVQNIYTKLYMLHQINTSAARTELLQLPGVGPKVADCVLLYSGAKRDVFPTDVWIKRAMEKLYFNRTASFKEIQQFANNYFEEMSGIAQQYLFYYARENKII